MKNKLFVVAKTKKQKTNVINKYIDEKNIEKIIEISDIKYTENSLIIKPDELKNISNWTSILTAEDETLFIIDNINILFNYSQIKRKHLKDYFQSKKNVIIMDILPFYTKVEDIFYPFYILDKSILGYNNLQSFKANHKEIDGNKLQNAHDFDVLKSKIENNFIMCYDKFFTNINFSYFEMEQEELEEYEKRKLEVKDFDNPIKIFNYMSEKINLIDSRFEKLNNLIKGDEIIVINCLNPYAKRIQKKLNKTVEFKSFHDKIETFDPTKKYIFLEMPIVKQHKYYQIINQIETEITQVFCKNINLEEKFKNDIYNIKLLNEFEEYFGGKNGQNL